MIDPLQASIQIASSGLEAQSTGLRVVSENLANANSTGRTPGADPYRRKTTTFSAEMDRAAGVNVVKVKDIGVDRAPFRVDYEPTHPAADQDGYVKLPNVNSLIEMADMRETNRSYEANLQVVKQARSMVAMTIDLLKGLMMLEAVSSILKGVGDVAKTSEIAKSSSAIGQAAPSAAGFDGVLEQVAADAIGTLKAGEAASISSIQGKVSAQRVVEAVMSAEQTLQMAVAVRDKVVQAYQEVSRMAI